ncbi:MAG: Gfo/Idh/MocA family protein [Gaiellaceae bacterium]
MSLRVFVVGLGSSGRRHLRNLQGLGVTADGGRLEAAGAWAADAIVVASPTSDHLTTIRWAIERGIHMYVEKPLAPSSDGVAAALHDAERAGLTLAVGYNLRSHPALEAIRAAVEDGRVGRLVSVRAEVGHYLPDWHPDEDYRDSYAAKRALGGGALLTLSHELDFVRWIAGEVVECHGIAARVSSLELDVDDVADVVLRHAGGTLSSVHMDVLDREYNRRSRWVGEDATIAWTWGGDVTIDGQILWHNDGAGLDQSYVSALRNFLGALAAREPPRATGRDGLRVLELCDAVRRYDARPAR